jgi:hypothetical protein
LAVGAKAAGTWEVIGRRIDAARRLPLQGTAPAYAATAAGFYDQAHLATFVCSDRGCSAVLNAIIDLELGFVVREK